MSSDGVSDVSAGAGERVGRMVNGTVLTSGSTASSRACGGGAGLWGQRLVSTMSWQRLGGFSEGDRRRLGEEVLGCWIQGEDIETFPVF